MKLAILVFSLGLITALNSSAQTTSVDQGFELLPPSNLERYNIDYTIVEWNSVDTTVLNQIDLAPYEKNRKDSDDIEVTLTQYNVTLKLYSKVKTLENESKSKTSMKYFRHLYVKEK